MKNLKEVDWSKAPEGATHYNAELGCPWLKETPASYFAEDKKVWVKYGSNRFATDDLRNAVKRPQEWDGVGLPPVGTICMLNDCGAMNAYYAHHAGKKLKIIAHATSSKGNILAVYMVIGEDEFHGLTDNLNFKPIKTPEQIESEERLHAIDEMLDFVVPGRLYREAMGLLYDAGYRKQGA